MFSALQSAVVGLVLTFSSVVLFPLVGWVQSGIQGGLIGGLVGSVLTLAIGTVSTISIAYQLIMGLVQTPVAIVSAWWQGKVWDPQQRKWRLYNLTHESELLEE